MGKKHFKFEPKRFADRKDRGDIIKAAKNFSIRAHRNIPNWMIYIFVILIVSYLIILLKFSSVVLDIKEMDLKYDYAVLYLVTTFLMLAAYLFMLIGKFRATLNAVEFVTLSVSRSLENLSSYYCFINDQGKIFYYNNQFASKFLASAEVESKKYYELLEPSVFNDEALAQIKHAIENKKHAKIDLTATKNTNDVLEVMISPVSRPEGIFTIYFLTKHF